MYCRQDLGSLQQERLGSSRLHILCSLFKGDGRKKERKSLGMQRTSMWLALVSAVVTRLTGEDHNSRAPLNSARLGSAQEDNDCLAIGIFAAQRRMRGKGKAPDILTSVITCLHISSRGEKRLGWAGLGPLLRIVHSPVLPALVGEPKRERCRQSATERTL